MRSSLLVPLALAGASLSASILAPQIPSFANFTPSSTSLPFVLTPDVQILVDPQYAYSGSPSLLEFAQTFRTDLLEVAGFGSVPAAQVQSSDGSESTIYLTLGSGPYTLYNGKPTGEGYNVEVSEKSIVIQGSEPIGVWWGTRTILHQLMLGEGLAIPAGAGTDVPGWEVRGFMLDAGRHWFEPSFLSDLCTYASFFKLNEFHIHASDNLWDPNWLYTSLWPLLYSGFRFQPSNTSAVWGVVPQLNESCTQSEFAAMQASCASRGVTIVPEIDTPGHSLAISQWKPELMLAGNPDQLNLSYPETIPTIQALWTEFLPWFTSPEVSIGADEYPSQYADEYISFVNTISVHISSASNKSIRAWGTYEPSTTSAISTAVTIQHWDFPGDTIPVQLMEAGYRVINSEQAFLYLDGKTSDDGQFPQTLDESLLWSSGWAPNIFSLTDPTNNTNPENPYLRGAIFALWEDWGNNATDPYEVYMQLSRSIAIFGEKTWAGAGVRASELTPTEFNTSYPALNARAPGQNLNRAAVPEYGNVVFSYDLSTHDFSTSGPFYTPYTSVGPPYTLTLTLTPTSSSGVLLSGPDTELWVSNLTFRDVPTNEFYPLAYSVPLDVPTTLVIHATQAYTYAVVQSGEAEGEGVERWWTTDMDIWGEYMVYGAGEYELPRSGGDCGRGRVRGEGGEGGVGFGGVSV